MKHHNLRAENTRIIIWNPEKYDANILIHPQNN